MNASVTTTRTRFWGKSSQCRHAAISLRRLTACNPFSQHLGIAERRVINSCFAVNSNHAQFYSKTSSQLRSSSATVCRFATLQNTPPRTSSFHISSQNPFSAMTATYEEAVIHDVFEDKTGTWQYIVADPSTLNAIIIDSVLGYDPSTQAIDASNADALLALVSKHGYKVTMILETHAHADHLTAASYLQYRLAVTQDLKPSVGIGKRIVGVQTLFGRRYDVPEDECKGVFDKLFEDDKQFDLGSLKVRVVHLPGHTPDHVGYQIGTNIFCGDSLFHADLGSARCDFPGGQASDLYKSGRRLLSLSDHFKIWTGHDYPPADRGAPAPFMTVKDHKEQNKHLKDGITEEEFVTMRTTRDAQLAAPRLIHPSLQVNIRAGRLPKPTEAGLRMLHLPMKSEGVDFC